MIVNMMRRLVDRGEGSLERIKGIRGDREVLEV